MPAIDLRRLRRHVWNWLPVFLEVAETGSMQLAAKRLNVTPAAVSRTVRLLQDELGAALFHRSGRGLLLNATGAALRDAIRRASSVVDAGRSDALADPFVGQLAVASLGVLTEHFVVPAILELKRSHPSLVLEHLNSGALEASADLLRGQADVAFYYEELTIEGISVERIGTTTASVYCGRGHPLFDRKRVSREQLLGHAFSVPQIGDGGRVQDGWPSDLPREVGMRVTLLRTNLEVCRSGLLLTVLPDVTAAPHVAVGELRRLGVVELPAIEMLAARHTAAPERDAARELVAAVRRIIAARNAEARRVLHERRPRERSTRRGPTPTRR